MKHHENLYRLEVRSNKLLKFLLPVFACFIGYIDGIFDFIVNGKYSLSDEWLKNILLIFS